MYSTESIIMMKYLWSILMIFFNHMYFLLILAPPICVFGRYPSMHPDCYELLFMENMWHYVLYFHNSFSWWFDFDETSLDHQCSVIDIKCIQHGVSVWPLLRENIHSVLDLPGILCSLHESSGQLDSRLHYILFPSLLFFLPLGVAPNSGARFPWCVLGEGIFTPPP